jgi:hypothetical protein
LPILQADAVFLIYFRCALVVTQPTTAARTLYSVTGKFTGYVSVAACRRDDGTFVRLLDMYNSHELTVPVFVEGKWQQKTVSTVTVILEYLSSTVWGDGQLDAYSNLLNNCWGALTTSTAWLGDKYGIVGCNATVSACAIGGVQSDPIDNTQPLNRLSRARQISTLQATNAIGDSLCSTVSLQAEHNTSSRLKHLVCVHHAGC